MFKLCTSCNQEKILSEFRKDKTQKDGHQPRCKLCARLSQSKHYQNNRSKILERNKKYQDEPRALVREYREAGKCKFCSETETCCLEFHHVNPEEKSFQLSNVTTQSTQSIIDEINKCVLVCRNCHSKIHSGIIKL